VIGGDHDRDQRLGEGAWSVSAASSGRREKNRSRLATMQ
jgi:hypothetical protein